VHRIDGECQRAQRRGRGPHQRTPQRKEEEKCSQSAGDGGTAHCPERRADELREAALQQREGESRAGRVVGGEHSSEILLPQGQAVELVTPEEGRTCVPKPQPGSERASRNGDERWEPAVPACAV